MSKAHHEYKPATILCYNEKGERFQIAREQWRSSVLPGQFHAHWDDPAALYQDICFALDDGFDRECLAPSAQLLEIDPVSERAAVVYAVCLFKNGRIDEAENILLRHIDSHGPSARALTGLAKIYSERDQNEKAEKTLWSSLEIDPNQKNGLNWWLELHGPSGPSARAQALCRVAAIPGSWRAQLHQAREALENGGIPEALRLYRTAIDVSGADADALMEISGELGKRGQAREALELVASLYHPDKHGPLPGINLLNSYIALREFAPARALLNQLYALGHPDLQERLDGYAAHLLPQ